MVVNEAGVEASGQGVSGSVGEKTDVRILQIFADTKRQSESKEVKGEATAGCVHDVGEHDVHGVLCANRTRAQHGEAKLERGGGREERGDVKVRLCSHRRNPTESRHQFQIQALLFDANERSVIPLFQFTADAA